MASSTIVFRYTFTLEYLALISLNLFLEVLKNKDFSAAIKDYLLMSVYQELRQRVKKEENTMGDYICYRCSYSRKSVAALINLSVTSI
jgi:hypothetical protein